MKFAVLFVGFVLILSAFVSAQSSIEGELTLGATGGTGTSEGISGRLCFAEGGEQVDPDMFDIGGTILLGCIDVSAMSGTCPMKLVIRGEPIVQSGEAIFDVHAIDDSGIGTSCTAFMVPSSEITYSLDLTSTSCAIAEMSFDNTGLNGVTGSCSSIDGCEISIERDVYLSADFDESWLFNFQDTGINLHMRVEDTHDRTCCESVITPSYESVANPDGAGYFYVCDIISILCPTCKTKNIPYALYQVTSQSQSQPEMEATVIAARESVEKLREWCDDGACDSGTRQAQLLDMADIYIDTAESLIDDGEYEQAELYAIQARISALDGIKVICTRIGNPPGCYEGPVSTEL